MKKLALIIGLLGVICIQTYAADSSSSSLNSLQSKIKDVQSYLTLQQSKRSHYEQQLKQSEVKSSELARLLQKTSKSLKEQKTNLRELENHQREYEEELSAHQHLLLDQLKASYGLTQDSYLKLLLNQQDPEKTSRNVQYYRYIQQSRLDTMNELKSLLNKIHSNQEQIKIENIELSDLKMQQQQEQMKLNIVQQDRKQTIQLLNNDIKTKNQKLKELLENKRRLEKTVNHLNEKTPQFITHGKNFSAMKGQLSWPTHGHIIQAYGSAIENSELHATGVLIAAPLDQAVYAIAPGKVIFAKWMTGYGLLLIIDHGNHYLSLYGRNHTLFKQEGDVVKAGEQIASVGSTGGFQTNSLYFALRHNADPLNPNAWMKAKP
jgi:septal ring factor EnvC (AmiA/AmiB activator)